MKINVKVITGARKNLIQKTEQLWTIYITTPPIDGKANKALVDFISQELDVAKSRIEIIKGLKSRHKTIIIEGI